jgi:hypothetical protein
MVRFENKKLVIELPAAHRRDAVENWRTLHAALCDAARTAYDDSSENSWVIPYLISHLLPETEV